uniref:Uncharacterized protein n=1 Tax=viral metagenome TaxID=1070528 RepID=A0A6H1ZXR6_9ZZZZ
MKLNINPFSHSNPMTLKDAAVVSTIAAGTIWILNFLASATYAQIVADPPTWLFEAVKTYAVAWAGNFITLAGLEELIKRREGDVHE